MQNFSKKIGYIIITYNGEKWLANLIDSLPKTSDILVIDNNSLDKTVEIAKALNCQIIQNQKNLGYGAAINQGIKHLFSKYDYFFILNQDLVFKSFEISDEDLNQDTILQPLILLPNGKTNVDKLFMNVFGFVYPRNYGKIFQPKTQNTLQLFSGSAFIISKKTFEEVGEFNESLFLYYEDIDYGIRCLLKDKKIEFCPKIIVEHGYINSFNNKQKKSLIYKNRQIIINRYFKNIWRKFLLIKKLPSDNFTASDKDKEKFAKAIKPHLLLGFFTPQIPLAIRTLTNLIMVPYSWLIKLFI